MSTLDIFAKLFRENGFLLFQFGVLCCRMKICSTEWIFIKTVHIFPVKKMCALWNRHSSRKALTAFVCVCGGRTQNAINRGWPRERMRDNNNRVQIAFTHGRRWVDEYGYHWNTLRAQPNRQWRKNGNWIRKTSAENMDVNKIFIGRLW